MKPDTISTTYRDFSDTLCFPEHALKQVKELVAADMFGNDEKCIDIGSRTMHT